EPSRKALDLIERFSDGRANAREFWSLLNVDTAEIGGERISQVLVMGVPAWWRITMALREVRPKIVTQLVTELRGQLRRDARKEEAISQSHLLRCIFGNPFHQITLHPDWSTNTVKTVAQQIYDEWGFDRLPFLANALEDAGCDNANLLNHCRSE